MTHLGALLVSLAAASCGAPAARTPVPIEVERSPREAPEASRVQFDPAVHAGRRARLSAALQAAGSGVFLAPSADGFSGGAGFAR